jgi:hypothetical protein
MKKPDVFLHLPFHGGSVWWLGDQFSTLRLRLSARSMWWPRGSTQIT